MKVNRKPYYFFIKTNRLMSDYLCINIKKLSNASSRKKKILLIIAKRKQNIYVMNNWIYDLFNF